MTYFLHYKGPAHGYVPRFLGFSVYISNTTDKEDGVLCFMDNQNFTKENIPAVITLNCTHQGTVDTSSTITTGRQDIYHRTIRNMHTTNCVNLKYKVCYLLFQVKLTKA